MHDETHPSQISSGVSEVTAVSLLLVDLIRAIRFGATQSSVTCAKPVPEVTSPPPRTQRRAANTAISYIHAWPARPSPVNRHSAATAAGSWPLPPAFPAALGTAGSQLPWLMGATNSRRAPKLGRRGPWPKGRGYAGCSCLVSATTCEKAPHGQWRATAPRCQPSSCHQ